MKHSKKVLTASIALLLGVSGAAFGLLFSGNLLENPGFEVEGVDAADAADWTQVGAARTADTGHNTPDWSMYMTSFFDGQVDVFSGSAYQMESVEGCSPYGLGLFEASGWHNNDGSSGVPGLSVDFDGTTFSDSDTDVAGEPDGYQQMTLAGNIPPFAMMAKFMVSGAGDGVPADLHWDDVEFSTDCVYDYAKVSGKLGQGNKGNGNNGMYSFSGAIGTLESEACGAATPVGMLHINYKSEGFSCDVTPTDPVVYDDFAGTATLAVSYLCEIVDDEDLEGSAEIVLTQGAGGAEGQGKNKDRGMISVDADDDILDIEEASLDKGNVNLMQPAACPE
ncbi:hypothetical protein [uncultured Shewanella sp.]|uniref:hypothetical protein n=1 Tax=uncultured Shewanella sp. TaxID=173975 RepID=UPI002606C041|nr:hypothetical protein [uncultured Shewanella sp.]